MERTPAVSCSGCGFSWNSAAMADGLRVLGSCPKCAGALVFRAETPAATRPAANEAEPGAGVVAPHLVLGLPRR